MKISGSSQLTSEPVPSVEIYSEPPGAEDIHWFNARLNPDSVGSDATSAAEPGVLSNFADTIGGSQRAQKDAFHDPRVASRSSNVEDFSRANAQLSNYYIESLMNAKIIGKAVQSVDKLSNLQ